MNKFNCLLLLWFVSSIFMLTSCEKDVTVGSIQGFVSNSSTNEPIQGVNISLSPTGLSTVTGSDGRYEFVNLEAGQYTVQGVKEGYESNTKNITIVAGNVSSGDMTLKPELSGFRLNVEYLDFGTNFSQLSFKIINTSTSLPISWSITESMAWLTATPSSGNMGAGQEVAVTVSIDRSQIEQSTTANLTVVSGDQTVVLPVNVTVSGSQGPQLQLSETSLDFGVSANNLAFYVMNTGPVGTSLNWACSTINVDWLMITPNSGNTDGGSSTAVMATIDRTKINGMVSTSVTISGAGSTSSISISASSEGTGVAILQLSEGSLDFGEDETTKTFMVKNVGSTGTVLDWSIAELNVDWLTLTPMSGNTNAGTSTQVTAVVDRNKFNGFVSTTIAVNGSNNSSSLSVSAAHVEAAMEISPTSVDFGTTESTKTITIKNVGDEGSTLHWSIATPEMDWLTASPMSGNVSYNQSIMVTLTIDRNAFVGNLTTNLHISGANSNVTVSVSVDNSVIVTDGLIAYYSFDDGAVTDWGGNYDGMNFGALTSNDTPSGEGFSFQFDGQTNYLHIPHVIIMLGVPWSYNLWIKTGSNNCRLFTTNESFNSTSTYASRSINIKEDSKLFCRPSGSDGWTTNNPLTRYLNNQWHMLTITFNGSVVTLYVDGVLFENKNWSSGYAAWDGYYSSATYFGYLFNGNMDNIRTYSRALTQEEIRALYNAKQ